MSAAPIGFFIALLCTFVLSMLFRHESIRGVRYAEEARSRADILVMKMEYTMHRTMRYVARDLVKQLGHYSFHTLLRTVLLVVTQVEKGLRNVMRVNKTLAKTAERESTNRTKLEELTLHKAEVALTEREKKLMKERSLRGM